MIRPLLFCVVLATAVGIACGPRNGDGLEGGEQPPAVAIPVHVLTEDRAGSVVEVEQGDWVEFEFPEPAAPLEWKQQSEQGLELAGPAAGETRDSETHPVRFFRYLARSVGRTQSTFELGDPDSSGPPDRAVTFIVNVR